MIFGSACWWRYVLFYLLFYIKIVLFTWAHGGSKACRHLLHSVLLPEQNTFSYREGRHLGRDGKSDLCGWQQNASTRELWHTERMLWVSLGFRRIGDHIWYCWCSQYSPSPAGWRGHIFFAQGDYYLPRHFWWNRLFYELGQLGSDENSSCPRTKRQATQHGCLPSLLGNGDRAIEIVYGRRKKICTEPTKAAKAEQKSLVPAWQA
jgi:hypothetical protein